MLLIILKTILMFPWLLWCRLRENKNKNLHIYGVYGFYGLAGKGKTMTMCQQLKKLRKRYGSDILITTNFYYNDEDFPLTHWSLLLKKYDKPLIVAYDEIVNEFNSRDYKNFPIELFGLLTQVRKDNGIMIMYTAQRWHFVDKTFRSLSFGCYECNTIMGKYTYAKMYDPVDYDNLCSQSDYEKRQKIKPIKYIDFVQTEDLRNCYDSFKRLETAKSKEYMDRVELSQLNKDISSYFPD